MECSPLLQFLCSLVRVCIVVYSVVLVLVLVPRTRSSYYVYIVVLYFDCFVTWFVYVL